MKNRRKILQLAGAALAALLMLTTAPAAEAGCGCDHPPPDWAQISPPFASPGTTVRIHADSFEFTVGASYQVKFDGDAATVQATESGAIEVMVPNAIKLGGQVIQVKGPGVDHKYPASLFTGLSRAFEVPANPGAFEGEEVEGAVSADGTLLIPLDVSKVLDPMQFALQFGDLRLRFDADDVVFHNADGVDLTLFTLVVEDETERQWGSYYGWNVEEDTGIRGDVYEQKVEKSEELGNRSDFLTYWRHEFYTYAAAHASGGSHAVDASGYHPDGTLHIDHGRLVLAISGGLVRDQDEPTNLDLAQPLEKGSVEFDLYFMTTASKTPIEPAAVRSNFASSEFEELWDD